VAQLFDDYADRFDKALVEKLHYTVPKKLATLIAAQAGNQRFAHVIDLGCGTGLFGERIRDKADHLEGFDLSANMLAKAEEKGIYDRLAQADLSLPPESCGLFAKGKASENRANLVSAADVLMYLGNLDSVFVIASKLIADDGLFAFSVEDGGDEGDFVLRESLRYAHSERYIRQLCKRFGLDILDIHKTTIRNDGGKPVSGILFLTKKSA
jgi:predicted TPR repeat methyltransferase